MRIGATRLRNLLTSNVVEIRFLRRTPGPVPFRRMLATNDLNLLNSNEGRIALNFKPPRTNRLHFNHRRYNLVKVWDVLMQDFRLVSMDNCEMVAHIQSTPPDEFWEFFNEKLSKMSTEDKIAFMRK